MKEILTEEDIQWLAKIIAMIPALAMPADTTARLYTHGLISERTGGWQATDKGIDTVVNWESAE